MSRPVAWSYSALIMYENCPRKYWAVKIKKIDDSNKNSRQGDAEHKGIEMHLKHGDPLPVGIGALTPMLQAIKASPGELYVEHKLCLNEQFVPCKWNDWDKVWLRTAADVIKVNGASAAYFDWKSGKAKSDDDMADQTDITALAIFRHFPDVQVVKGAAVFYRHDRLARNTVYRADEGRLWNSWLERLKPLKESYANDNWPVNPNPLCGWCPYLACPHNKTTERLAREAAKGQ